MRKFTKLWSLVLALMLGLSMTTYAQGVHEGAEPAQPQERETFNSRAGDAEITLELYVDTWWGEASWNIYDVDAAAYYYGSDQTFSSSGDYTYDVTLTIGTQYEFHVWDSYGDGGVDGEIYHGDVLLTSWDGNTYPYDYSDFGAFPFMALADAPEGLTGFPNPESMPGEAMIDLTWDGAGARALDSYNVYRSVAGDPFEMIGNVGGTSHTDADVTAGTEYEYYIEAVYTEGYNSYPSEHVMVTAADMPVFAIDPESYMFEEVGILDGEPYGEPELADFSVTNTGVGTLNITEQPYFFSGQPDNFFYEEDGVTYPVPVSGPFGVTGESYDFQVGFAPTTAGLSSTLLVVTDDLGRVTRTFELNGSAYNIPDYDIMENALVITQDWQVNNDFNTAMDFADFHDDYALAPGNDVVYQFTVTIDSYFEVMENAGTFSDFAVFADGDEFTAGNDLYTGGQLAIDAGTYYVVATGSGEFDFDIHIEGQEPVLVVDPTTMDLGDVPIGCWHEGGTFEVYNDGGQTITFLDASLSDENGVFELDYHFDLPITISTETLEFDITLNADTEGLYEGAFLLEDENTTYIYPISGYAYNPVIGDVICDPVVATFDGSGHFEDDNSVAAPMRDNYHVVAGYNDVVYQFSYANDFIIDIALDNAVMDPHMQLFSAEDVLTVDPDELTPIAEGGQEILDAELWAGTYYLVVAGDQTTTPEYTLTLDVEDMPAPGEITLLTPADGTDEVPIDMTLTWDLGDYTNNIDVYVDTQYPPQDKVLGNGAPVETLDVEGLSPAQIYFWKVVAHNSNGSTESETWAFTTQLPPPLFVQGEIFDYVNVHLWWNNPFDATYKVTEDFENGELPEGWTMTTNATGSSAGWFVTNEGGSSYFDVPPHTYYAISNDDANNGDGSEDYLIMPAQDFSQWDGASLSFESFYTGDYSQSAYVEVSTDGGDTWEVVHELEPNGGWTLVTVELDDYLAESDVHVAFHADDNGAWASGWAVDDVELAFEADLGTNRALLGYNVWQNGTMINDELVTVEEYDVMDLAAGDYVFGVSAVYDEGESEIVEIETITILGMSEIAGTVTDYVTGDPIEGANIEIMGMWEDEELEYSVSTDADGNYSQVLPVTLDGYDVTASASGYVAQTEEDVMPAAAVTEVVDFALGEFPIPVGNVVAVSNDSETVATVTWDSPSGFPSYEIIYDDGIATNATAWNAGFEGNMNALKFTPSGYPCTINEMQIHIWDGTWPAGDVFNPMEIVILDDDGSGGLPGTELGAIEVTPTTANWVTVDLSSLNVSISDGEFYIANRQISTYPDCPPTGIAEGTPQNRSYSYTGGAWGTASYDSFMIRATVSGPQGTEQLGYEGDNVNVKTRANEGAVAITATDKAPGTYVEGQGTTRIVSEAPANTRAVEHYEVWRFAEEDYDTPADWDLLADDVTVTEYEDATFADLPWGVYYYAVKAVYPITEAEPVVSNMLPKDIYSNTIFMVELNTGDVPEGVMVKLENLEDPEYVYEATTDATGQVQFEEVWKGEYLLTVTKEGYDPHFENVTIVETYFIHEVMLYETLAAPINLTSSVNCDEVVLNWEEGQGGNFEMMEDFEGDFPPEGWMTETNGEGWFQTADGSSSFFTIPPTGSLYACSNDDAPGSGNDGSMDYLITPEMGFTGFTEGTLTFESFYNGDYSQEAYVKISNNGGDTWSVIHTLSPSDSWEEITVDLEDYLTSEYASAWIAFHADDAGAWASGWAIDNVHIELGIGAREVENREFTGFNVYRNDMLLTNTPITETTYTDMDVPGGTFDYFVAAVYTTGQSDPSNIATVDVEVINPAQELTAEKQAWDNVFLEWMPPSDQPIYSLRYDDGENFNSIGTNDVFDFAVASRWTPDQLGFYDGQYLTAISFFPAEEDCEYYARVWTGEDATLVAEQLVTDVTIGEWNTVHLDTPVMIDASEEFWFGYRANAQTGYPAGTDAGPAVAGYGDMIYDAESGWLSMAEAYGLDYNWNLVGTVTSMDGGQAQLTEIEETITNTASDAAIAEGGINPNPVQFNLEGREFEGFNVYRDGEMIAEGIETTFYIDYDVRELFPQPFPEDGVTFAYNVVATYSSGCEAEMSNTATAYYGVDNAPLDTDAVKVYPNPAQDFVNIQLTDNVETLRVINYVGQEVYSKTITDEDIIQVERLEAGAYIVRLTTNTGETITKRFVVVK